MTTPQASKPVWTPFRVIIAALMAVLVVVGGITWLQTPQQTRTAPVRQDTYTVVYRVTGTARSVSLTYNNAGGDTEQRDANVPWNTTFQARAGQFVYLSAQNKGEYGSVVCEIVLNGTVVKRAQSEGAYKIASCSGRV